MKGFFSCDWGSTRFRLRLIDASNLNVIAEIQSNDGVREMYEQWNVGKKGDRQQFFCNYLFEQLEKINQKTANAFEDVPILISGMASSNIGLMELPYKHFPIKTDGSDLIVKSLSKNRDLINPVFLISGARTEEDVVRGEETMMVGCDHEKDNVQLLIFPGTHSKHILIQDGIARNIRSFLTGEMFNLLSTKSILSNSIKKPEGYELSTDAFFTEGVRKGSSTNFLHGIFQVRINDLFKTATAEENYAFLTGILIGHELKDLAVAEVDNLLLVCSEELNASYLQTLKVLYPNARTIVADAGVALIKGQWKVLQSLKH